MKIFLGLTNVSSMYLDLKKIFKKKGIETFIVNKDFTTAITKDYCDFNVRKAQNRVSYFKPRRISSRIKPWWDRKVENYILNKALAECDVFIFFWDTFHADHSDLEKIKKKGKTIINVFVGDDVRWYFGMKQEYEAHGLMPVEYGDNYNYTLTGLEKRLRYIRTAEKYADFIFSRFDQAQLELRPYYRWNMMVPPSDFPHSPHQRETPIVAHAPSDRGIKGTKYVLEAFDRLKKEGINFESLLIENVPHEKAKEMYCNADILIDQLLCPGTGKLATEALVCGTIVMSRMGYDNYPQKNPKECPIVDVGPETIYPKLKDLITNLQNRKELAMKGRPYVEKYLDVEMFCNKVIDLVNKKQIPFDYEPTFFREQFIPESKESILVYNKWTETVKDCHWYKTYVKSGERAGLKF